MAKEAADIILTDDNFATIEKAIEEGRGVYANIKKSVLFLLSSNFGEIMTMFVAVVMGFALQIAVTEIPHLTEAFGTASLSLGEWVKLSVLASFPLLAHEILVLLSGDRVR